MDERYLKVLRLWHLRCLRIAKCNYTAAGKNGDWDRWLTFINVTATIILIGLSTATWVEQMNLRFLPIAISSAAVIIAVTSILQYVMDFKGRAIAHQHSAAEYARLARKIDVATVTEIDAKIFLNEMQLALAHANDSSPLTSRRVWRGEPDIRAEITRLEKSYWAEMAPEKGSVSPS